MSISYCISQISDLESIITEEFGNPTSRSIEKRYRGILNATQWLETLSIWSDGLPRLSRVGSISQNGARSRFETPRKIPFTYRGMLSQGSTLDRSRGILWYLNHWLPERPVSLVPVFIHRSSRQRLFTFTSHNSFYAQSQSCVKHSCIWPFTTCGVKRGSQRPYRSINQYWKYWDHRRHRGRSYRNSLWHFHWEKLELKNNT
jgi:hypothetical protein